jgi:hypothetical protein
MRIHYWLEFPNLIEITYSVIYESELLEPTISSFYSITIEQW